MPHRNTTELNIKGFIETYAKKTFVDFRFQRRQVWKNKNKIGFRDSVLKGHLANPIIIVDVDSCIKHSQYNKNESDFQYFTEIKEKEGKSYISIDGNNRTNYILNENERVSGNPTPEDEIFFSTHIPITVFSFCTRMDMHTIAINTNRGIAWNKQEERNAIYGVMSDFIRDTSIKLSSATNFIHGVNKSRMQDDDLYAMLLTYHQHPVGNVSNALINSIYKKPSIDNQKEFIGILDIWAKIIQEVGGNKYRIDKSLAVNLFMFLYEMYHNSGRKFNEDLITDFSSIYIGLEESRILESNDWKLKNRYANKYLIEKSDKIISDILSYVNIYFLRMDPKRSYSVDDKIEIYRKNGGDMFNLDGTTEEISLLQALNGNFINADHVLPFSKGNPTSIENAQFLKKEDNLKKSDKVLTNPS